MARKGSVLVLASAVLTLAACSSSDGEATPPTSSTPATIATTTTAPTTTSTPPTTQAPTTTIDPAETLAAEVEADLLEAFRLGREASQDPFDAAKEEAALDRRLGVIADNFAGTLADYRSRNLAIRPNADTPASVTIEGTPTFLGSDNEVAEVQICEVNSWILVEVGAGPNGTDAIVDPNIIAARATIFMRSVDGVWRFEGSSLIGEWEGATECAPA